MFFVDGDSDSGGGGGVDVSNDDSGDDGVDVHNYEDPKKIVGCHMMSFFSCSGQPYPYPCPSVGDTLLIDIKTASKSDL